ncbi:MAG: phosphate signaling complex PhoU family protein [Phycisphaerae bacterium]
MLLKEVINAFRKKNVVQEMTQQIGQMVEAGCWMFEQVSQVLMSERDWESVAEPLYQRDQKINRLEQSIRERVVTHLSLDNKLDLGPCLVLMSVVKDAERIGDYCKNIYEVGKFFRSRWAHPEYVTPLNGIREEIGKLFGPVQEVLKSGDTSRAREIIGTAGSISKKCEVIIQQLLSTHADFPADEAVAYVLLARHYKRVVAHLSNIATSIVSPVPLLDFPGAK